MILTTCEVNILADKTDYTKVLSDYLVWVLCLYFSEVHFFPKITNHA